MRRAIVVASAALAVFGVGGAALAHTLQYRAHPTGAFEVPANDSGGEGVLKVKVASDGLSARFDLKITEPLTDILQSHLHMGPVGSNGPIVVWLYPAAPPAQLVPGEFEGRLNRGEITPDDLCFSPTAPLCGRWDAFLELLESGGLYVNVHTVGIPSGEIRDQVMSH